MSFIFATTGGILHGGVGLKLVERVGELRFILGYLLAQSSIEKMEKSSEKIVWDRGLYVWYGYWLLLKFVNVERAESCFLLI